MKNSNLEIVRALMREMNEELKGGQKKLDVAAPFGKLTGADFKKLRGTKKEAAPVEQDPYGEDPNLDIPADKDVPEQGVKEDIENDIRFGLVNPRTKESTVSNNGEDPTIEDMEKFIDRLERGTVRFGRSRYDSKRILYSIDKLIGMYKELNTPEAEERIKYLDSRKFIYTEQKITENHKGQDHKVSEALGNRIGDTVNLRGDVGKKFPPSEGYYGIIEDYTVARNYNMNAIYKVAIYNKDNKKVSIVRGDWENFTDRPINENHEGQDHEVSMANNSLDSILWAVGELKKHLGDQERDIPAWIQDHITNAENYIVQAAKNFHDYGAEEPTDDMSLAAMAPAELNEMIKKVGKKYNVYSKKGKKLGSHPSKKKAQKQMAAIEISKQGK